MFVYVRHNLRCIYVRTCKMYVSSGALIGFVNTGSINTHLSNLGHLLEKGSGVVEQPLAKTMLVVMVRGLFSGLQFPYVQFPCGTLRGDQMFHILWKTVGRLERYGFRVMGLTCDGLAANRQLFRLHAPRGSTELVHKVTNPHSSDRRNFFFFSDPPHLLKTLRNCLANKNRHLWVSSDLSCCVLTSLDLCIVFCCSSTSQSAGATL